MNTKRKILCLMLLMTLIVGMPFLAMTIMPNVSEDRTVIERPDGNFIVAAAATSDAIATGANNITNTRGAAASNYVFAGAYELYYLVLNVSDADGFADILNVTAEFVTTASPGVSLGGFFCDTATATVTVTELVAGAGNVRLAAGSTNISAGNVIDITIPFRFEWAIGSQTDVDINVTVMEAAASSELTKDANIDIVGTLSMSDTTMFAYAEYFDGEAFGTIGLTYHYTGYTTIYPLAAETDFYVSMAAVSTEGIVARAWESTAYDATTGIASFNNIVAPNTLTEITLTFTEYAVTQSGGSGGTTLMSTIYTDTVVVSPNAKPVSERTTRDGAIIGADFFSDFGGVILIGGAAVVFMAGAYMYSQKSVTSTSRTTRKRSTKKRKSTTRKSSKRKR